MDEIRSMRYIQTTSLQAEMHAASLLGSMLALRKEQRLFKTDRNAIRELKVQRVRNRAELVSISLHTPRLSADVSSEMLGQIFRCEGA